ncbi:hypothetical protein BGZ63DRAFT_393061 [Mariannaea sp. PMI_226]|nr:hypothetical protein BGZ63DRAFT_393061 [Mariannaea sp. PMI_226]
MALDLLETEATPRHEELSSDTCSRASSLAKDEVFRIPELLETIISCLDMVTILVSVSRVSKHWSSVVANSPKIQQKLYFRPTFRPFSSQNPQPNSLLIERFGDVFFDLDGETTRTRCADSFLRLPWAPPGVWGKWGDPWKQGTLDKLEPEELQRCFTRRGASWRQMLVSQPPPPFLGVVWLNRFDISDWVVRTALIQPTSLPGSGLTMGELYDITQHFSCLSEDDAVWFRIHWNAPSLPLESQLLHQACAQLLKQTNIVIEIHETRILNGSCGPFSMSAIANMFRSEDAGWVTIPPLTEFPSTEDVRMQGEYPENMDYWPYPYERSVVVYLTESGEIPEDLDRGGHLLE